ncbi:MAG: hypothetical protein CMM93_07065 [Rickettsiales bacterium]|nr:hypothetical protein [Rickettsiales bacterium]
MDKNVEPDVGLELESRMSDETAVMDLFKRFEESQSDESEMSSIPEVKKETPYASEEQMDSSSDKSISEDLFSEHSEEEKVYAATTTTEAPTKVHDMNHREVILGIYELAESMKSRRIKAPDYDEKKLKKNYEYAEEIFEIMNVEYRDKALATDLREIIITASRVVPMIFNGKYNKILKTEMIDLTGYDLEIQKNITMLRSESNMVARKFNGSDLGSSLGYMLKMFKIFGVPLFTVYLGNRRESEANKKYNRFADLDSEDSSSTD